MLRVLCVCVLFWSVESFGVQKKNKRCAGNSSADKKNKNTISMTTPHPVLFMSDTFDDCFPWYLAHDHGNEQIA